MEIYTVIKAANLTKLFMDNSRTNRVNPLSASALPLTSKIVWRLNGLIRHQICDRTFPASTYFGLGNASTD
jgi:hypothetical protein